MTTQPPDAGRIPTPPFHALADLLPPALIAAGWTPPPGSGLLTSADLLADRAVLAADLEAPKVAGPVNGSSPAALTLRDGLSMLEQAVEAAAGTATRLEETLAPVLGPDDGLATPGLALPPAGADVVAYLTSSVARLIYLEQRLAALTARVAL